ncbi:phosphoglycerate kinase [Candidatus Parcubacteria bacterium]|nr:MAG: phosphoglycerate kinase [Candidatus Parcubacteria bacterium]
MKTIKQIRNLKGKNVLVRVDFNVPIKRGKVLDDTRLHASLPTIEYLMKKKAKVILVTHIGRPGGKVVASLKVDLVVKRLSELLKKKVTKLETENWRLSDKKKMNLLKKIDKMRPGQVALMENIRFSQDEKKDTGTLSQELANLVDYFVLDGFAVAHRPSASVVGVAQYVPSYAGLLLESEIKGLEKVLQKPKAPFVVVLGGAKMETKVPVMKKLVPLCDFMLIGGGVLNTYLKARGYGVGSSLIDMTFKKEALNYGKRKKVIKPVDVVVGSRDGKSYRLVALKKTPHKICKKGEEILDIGPHSINLYSQFIKEAETLVWNGAIGYFEQKPYDIGTLSVARLVAGRSKGQAYGVIGGGETLQSMDMVGMTEFVDLVSTGGGAMLEFLSGKRLPGIDVVCKK